MAPAPAADSWRNEAKPNEDTPEAEPSEPRANPDDWSCVRHDPHANSDNSDNSGKSARYRQLLGVNAHHRALPDESLFGMARA